MKSESTIKPNAYSVENFNGIAEVVLYENIAEQVRTDPETGDSKTCYTYDEYRINVPYRDNLSQAVKANRDAWLSVAMEAENTVVEKKTLEEEVVSLKSDNEIMGAALEEVIALVAGGEA